MGARLYITGILLDLDEGNPQARRALGERVKRHLWFIIGAVVLRTVTVLHFLSEREVDVFSRRPLRRKIAVIRPGPMECPLKQSSPNMH